MTRGEPTNHATPAQRRFNGLDSIFGSGVMILGGLILLIAIGYSVLAFYLEHRIPIWFELTQMAAPPGQAGFYAITGSAGISVIAGVLLIWFGHAIFHGGEARAAVDTAQHETSCPGKVVTNDHRPGRLRRLLYGLLAASGVLLTLTSGLCTVYTGGDMIIAILRSPAGPGGAGDYAFGLAPIFINTGAMLILCGAAIYCGSRAIFRRPWRNIETNPRR